MKTLVIVFWNDIKGCKDTHETYTSNVNTSLLRFQSVFEHEILDWWTRN